MPTEMHLQMAKALRLVRPMIEQRRWTYICWALGTVCEDNPSLIHAVCRTRAWIYAQLRGYSIYEDWARSTVGHCPTKDEARRARLAWIDWMISDLEKE